MSEFWSGVARWLTVYVINSVWQVTVLAGCTAVLARMAARGGARLQYRLWVGCLVLAVLLPAVSAMGPVRLPEWPWHRAEVREARPVMVVAPAAGVGERMSIYADEIVLPAKRSGVGTVPAWLYAASVLIGAVRLGRRLWATRVVARGARPVELPPAMAEAMERSAKALGMRPVEVWASAAIPCPAAVSWPRPRLLIPEAFGGTPEDETEAAIAHELAHIRRWDFETNLAMETLAVFAFYHPAMRWVKRRIAETREAVCDEMAAEITRGKTAYARSLLRLAEGVRGSMRRGLMLGVVEGSGLKGRIMRLLDERLPLSRRYRLVSAACCWAALAGLCVGAAAVGARPSVAEIAGRVSSYEASLVRPLRVEMGLEELPTGAMQIAAMPGVAYRIPVRAQVEAAALPSFDAATIKPPDPNAKRQIVGFYSQPGGRVFVGYATVKMLMYFAFGVQEFQIAGGPQWADTERWNIEAIPPDSSPTRTADVPPIAATPTKEQRKMLQDLLAKRFGLKFHRETREGPVYYLTTNGKKLNMNAPKDSHADPRGNLDSTGWAFGTNVTMADWIEHLTRALELPVIDRTGLKGSYDFQLDRVDPENKDIAYGVIEISRRLGLDLKSGKGPVETIMIDSVNKPTEN